MFLIQSQLQRRGEKRGPDPDADYGMNVDFHTTVKNDNNQRIEKRIQWRGWEGEWEDGRGQLVIKGWIFSRQKIITRKREHKKGEGKRRGERGAGNNARRKMWEREET